MAYEYASEINLDYFPCRYGTSRNLFRGPRRDLSQPYAVTLGGSETYGKFIQKPFPNLVEDQTNITTVNLGFMNAGLDVYIKDQVIMDIAAEARVCVVQIMGALNMTNRFYAVHPRRNDRFLHASPLLQTIFSDVDFTQYNFTRHMLSGLQIASREKFAHVMNEIRTAWVARMKFLLSKMKGRTVLLWIGASQPPKTAYFKEDERNPLMIDAQMIEMLKEQVTSYVEYIPSAKSLLRGVDGMAFGPFDLPAARLLPGVDVHREIATLIAEEVSYHF